MQDRVVLRHELCAARIFRPGGRAPYQGPDMQRLEPVMLIPLLYGRLHPFEQPKHVRSDPCDRATIPLSIPYDPGVVSQFVRDVDVGLEDVGWHPDEVEQ